MKKIKYLTSFIFAFCLGFFVINYNGNDMATRVPNNNKTKDYYKDYNGDFWNNQSSYEEYRDEEYFLAPDGSYWLNEYRYEQSKN
jgi:hypothetical protein